MFVRPLFFCLWPTTGECRYRHTALAHYLPPCHWPHRYNRLLQVITQTLRDLLKALKGLVVMSLQLELMAASLYNNTVPELWNAKAYPSLKPLSSWVMDLLQRLDFLQTWIQGGVPAVFWISGFFFPQAFLTGTLQNFARKSVISIDTIAFDFKVWTQPGPGQVTDWGTAGWQSQGTPEWGLGGKESHARRGHEPLGTQSAGYQLKWQVSDGQAGRALRRELVPLDPNSNPDSWS